MTRTYKVPSVRIRSEMRLPIVAIQGMGVEEAAIYLAKRQGGVLRVFGARRTMVQAGVIPSGNPGSALLWRTLRDSALFTKYKDQRGMYLLSSEYDEQESEVTGETE